MRLAKGHFPIERNATMKNVKHYLKDGTEHKGKSHKMPDGSSHTGALHNRNSKKLFHANELPKAVNSKIKKK